MGLGPPFWRHRSVLVTGPTGLLGGWLIEALLARGASVVCLVRDGVPQARFHTGGIDRKVIICQGDVTDQAILERVLGEHEVRCVFHLAAQTIVGIANRNPVSTFQSNIAGTWAVLEACRRSPLVSEVVIASSDKAYGEQVDLPYREIAPLQGRSPYDVSKSCADLIAQSYAATWGTPVIITRCGNFFGGGDLNWNRLVPGSIRSLLAGEAPLIRSDGRFVRDYLYVEDGAEAYIHAAEALSSNRALAGCAYNFSLERPLTVLQMIELLGKTIGVAPEPVILNEATNEIPAQYLDSTRARQELGWAPEVGLEEGLRRTVDWYRDHLKHPL
ncbi:MAG: sugar dehydratase [Pseudonocardiales bacterium]|nr:MAG: sugar dehydratase [Pseudonocardiales bacterium]